MGPRQRKVLRDLSRSRLLFSAVVLLLTFGIGMFIAIYSAFQDLRASESATYEETKFADAWFSLQPASVDAVDAARRVPGVTAAAGRIVQDIPMQRPSGGSSNVTARLISLPDSGRPAVNDVVVRQGQYPAVGDASGVMVDDQFAGVYGLRPGDSITLLVDGVPQSLRITGTFVSPEYIWKARSAEEPFVAKGEFAVVMARKSLVDQVLHTTGKVNEVAVRFAPGADQNAAIAALRRVLAPYGVQQVTPRADQISYALLMLDLNGFNKIGIVAPALFLLISALVIYALLARTIQGQCAIIGMMRAVGFSRGQVLRHFLTFSLLIATLGGLLGVLLGLALGWYVTRLYVQTIGIPVLRVEVHWAVLAIGLVVGFLVCIAAGLRPALTASALPPSEAMRPSPPSAHRSALVEGLIRVLKPPYFIRLAFRNLVRVRGRTASSAFGVAMAVGLVVAAVGMIDSMHHGLAVQFDQTQQYDVKARFVGPVPESGVTGYASWEQVAAVEPLLELPVTLTHGVMSQNVQLTGAPEESGLLRLQRTAGSVPLQADGLFISNGLASKLGAAVGDTITVSFGTTSVAMPVAGTVLLPLSSGAYIRLSQAEALTGAAEPLMTSVLLKLRAPADLAQVREMLSAQPNILSVETPSEARHSFEQLMALFYEFVGIFVLFGISLGAIAVFNTVMINVIERRQELATMRTLGFRRRTVDALLSVENLLIGAVGALAGLGIGYVLEIGLLSLFKSSLFELPVYISPLTYLIVGVGSLVLLLLSQAPGLRALNRLDLAAITKERAS